MTREEARFIIKAMLEEKQASVSTDTTNAEALEYALNAIDMMPITSSTDERIVINYPFTICDDAISREAVNTLYDKWRPRLATHVSEFGDALKMLPLVTPSRRKAHWLRVTTVNPKEFCNRCSECGYEQFYAERYKFCPNCGAEMG